MGIGVEQKLQEAGGAQLWKIGELAHLSGVAVATIRYYESLGLLEPAQRSRSGYRYYDTSAKRRLEFIKKAQILRFSLAEIRQILSMRGRGDPACPVVVSLLENKITELEEQISRLQSLKGVLATYRDQWRHKDFDDPSSEHLCSLIERVEATPA
ncbi:heavy metal-responsive transcriptional regulator [Gloeobacter kilaueensis]|uniref:MerR family transcriptional regulator n=1 Tax=Gloeobacter kilaueensis (strain ATCC BAA-2537 / CCAP 1431/1 / ULC 316 / JS1) TaxID=1183438 RepID=U5QH22_GLOK1|nr:heavy metal-responsive transcriptional regulator [Gloeobacter kilaueensis]AGY58272.1 MerR family transcriptional regulator [Gloeobacter kilaueensis JS1]